MTAALRLLVLLMLVCCRPAAAAVDVLTWSTIEAGHNAPRLLKYEDRHGGLGIDKMAVLNDAGFERLAGNSVTEGFSLSAFWLKFGVHNDHAHRQTLYIELTEAKLDHVQLFVGRGSNPDHYEALPIIGRMNPVSHQSRPSHTPVFILDLEGNEEYRFMLRVQSYPGTVTRIKALTGAQYYEAHIQHVVGAILFLGVVVALAAYNFFLFVSFRDVNYLAYCACSLLLCACMLSLDGWLYPWMGEAFWAKQRLFMLLIYPASFMLIVFSRGFLGVPNVSPALDRFLKLALVIDVVFLLLSVSFYGRLWVSITQITVVLNLSLIMTCGMVAWRRGVTVARLFVMAWCTTLLGAIITILAGDGFLPPIPLFQNMAKYAQIVTMILMSFALADSINVMRGQREEALRQAALVNAKSQAQAQFLAHMSHEIRTPMNGVVGLTELLAGTRLDAEQTRYVTTISQSAKSLVGILNDILEFAKLDSGDLQAHPRPVVLRKLIEDIRLLFEPLAREKQLEFRQHIDDRVPAVIEVDPARLRQVLVNLIGNGIKFTDQGHITLNIRESTDGTRLILDVSDTGPGIPAEARATIFRAFEQADNRTSRKHDGTGLGLAIANTAASLMQGTLDFTSEVGRGTTFRLDIPCVAAMSTPATDTAPVPEAPEASPVVETAPVVVDRPRRILVVEDNAVNQMVIKGLLKKLGLDATIANNGQEAVDHVRETQPDVILMDCHMPVMDGFEATREIRRMEANAQWHHIPIIAVTADVMVEQQEHCREVGMDDYIPKPIDKVLFKEKLSHWLGVPLA